MSRRTRRRGRQSNRRKGLPLSVRRVGLLAGAMLAGVIVWVLWPFWHLSLTFGERASVAPSRVYARGAELARGEALASAHLESLLAAADYRPRRGAAPAPGEYARAAERWIVHRRSMPTPAGVEPPALLEVELRRGRVRSLSLRGQGVRRATLEPPLLATLLGPDLRERRPVALEALPEDLVRAVLAAEDDGFFTHAGISLTGISRAVWSNLRSRGPLQGGSTLTQQLVKNLYLTHERTLARKAREAVLAVLIELRYDKRDILEAYLNEIYWGQSGGANLIGVGAAARAYFGKDPQHLDLVESAALAGVIQAPNYLSPVRHPERARARRDRVLGRMLELGWLSEEDHAAALARPLEARPLPVTVRRAPHFVDRAVEEAARRYGVDAATTGGLTLLTTLDLVDQGVAEEAVAWGLEALAGGWESGRKGAAELEAALVSVEVDSGAVQAWVGGRDYSRSQFDRAVSARRQAGSAFKPVVYAAAFRRGVVNPASMLPDEPLVVRTATSTWEPQNDDRSFQGWVTVRTAVERSLNVPTARVALATGLEHVIDTARAMGIDGALRPYPALALGAFEVTPEELTRIYATLAAGGLHRPLYGIAAVLDGAGRPLGGEPLPEARRALSPQIAYVLTSILQGVVERGTASSLAAAGLDDPLAGKTGTTNGRRDSWFGGYSPERATLVWVGYDDNRETRLSGARAALPVWARFMAAVRPAGGYAGFARPPGIETATIDPSSGLRAVSACPEARTEAFLEGDAPWQFCYLHETRRGRRLAGAREAVRETDERPRRSWWKRLFGRGKTRDDG